MHIVMVKMIHGSHAPEGKAIIEFKSCVFVAVYPKNGKTCHLSLMETRNEAVILSFGSTSQWTVKWSDFTFCYFEEEQN